MNERDLQAQIDGMCNGCIFFKNDRCAVPQIGEEGQGQRAAEKECGDSVVYSIDTKMFPLVETSVVSVVRYQTAAGRWDIQVKS